MTAVTGRVSTRLADREYSTNEQSFTIPLGSSREEVEATLCLAKLVAETADKTFSLPQNAQSETSQAKAENGLLHKHLAKLQEENRRKSLLLAKFKEEYGDQKFKEICDAVEGSQDWASVGTHSKID